LAEAKPNMAEQRSARSDRIAREFQAAEVSARDKKTARLRALRLAKEADEAQLAAEAAVGAKPKKKASRAKAKA
jgi:hypothetical protein